VGGDGGAHGPRAEHSDPAYPVRHRSSTPIFAKSSAEPTQDSISGTGDVERC
jgi:hypothetical protein